jgi:hypothetical protein
MRIRIIVVSPDELICRTIKDRQGQLVPEVFRRNHDAFGNSSFQLSCLQASTLSLQQLLDRIEPDLTDDTDGVVIISDRTLGLATRPLSDLYFVNEFDQIGQAKSPQNMLSSILNRVLRDFRILTIRFVDIKYQKLFRLPARNFIAAEFGNLRNTCVNSIGEPDFQRRLDGVLASFRHRQHPKRKSDYKDEYLVDDQRKHFQLGHEQHAQADTNPPHTRLCRLSNQHRFGCRFDQHQHYNVSMEGKNARMNSAYPDCHDQMRPGEGRTHLNIFTNDYF